MKSEKAEIYGLDPGRIPSHVAVIMDGNGRWARKRMLNRIKGHEQGAQTVRTIVRTTREIGIPYLTLYAFSTENWARPAYEISALMTLLKRFVVSERDEMLENGIRLNVIGQVQRLPDDVRAEIEQSIALTSGNKDMTLTLALSYGGRDEITRAARSIAQMVLKGEIGVEEVTEKTISGLLDTAGMPDPDLLIRTSGEFRISNFLLWQIAYAEIFVTKTLWPDFSKEEYIAVLKDYQERDRRFGRVDES